MKKPNPLLAVKGIGKTVLQRLQQMGLDDVATLAAADLEDILEQGAKLTGSTCWKTVRRPVQPYRLPLLGRSSNRQRKIEQG